MSVVTAIVRAPRKVFYGWWIVLAAAAMNVYGAGVWSYGFPLFFPKIIAEFGWTRAATAGAFAFSRVEGGLEGPIIGYLVDRFGPRILAMIGATIAGIGFMAMSSVNSLSVGGIEVSALVVFYLVFAVLIPVGYNTGFGHTAQPAIANWFIRKRSRAFAFWSLGAGASGITVAVLGWAIESFGWRQSAFMVGLGMFVIVIPLCLVLRHKPEQYGMLPDGEKPGEALAVTVGAGAGAAEQSAPVPAHVRGGATTKLLFGEYDFSVREALATPAFWFLLLGSAARSITMTAIVIHQVVYLEDVGFSFDVAKNTAATMVLFSLIGRFSFGWLGDFYEKRYVLMTTIGLQLLGIVILDRVNTLAQVLAYVAIYSIGYGGAIPVWTALRGEYFGRRYFATIGGVIQFLLMPATVTGPIFAGLVFDRTKSYHWAFMSFVVCLAFSVGFIFLAKRPKPPMREDAVQPLTY